MQADGSGGRRGGGRLAGEALVAASAVLAPLAIWAAGWGETDAALLALLPALAAVLSGTWSTARRRGRVWADAVMEPGSWLRPLLGGRAGALLAAPGAAVATVPAAAWFALSAGPAMWALLAGLALVAAGMLAAAERRLAAHVRPGHRRDAAKRPAVLVAGTAALLGHAAIAYGLEPLPPHADAPTLAAAVAMAAGELPAREGPAAEVLAGFAAADAAVLWLLAREGFSTLPLLLYLLFQGAIAYALARVAVETAAAVFSMTERERDGGT